MSESKDQYNPANFTRSEIMETLRELRDKAALAEAQRVVGFVRWPDLDAMLDHIEKNGLPE
jgi:hypothetical protein